MFRLSLESDDLKIQRLINILAYEEIKINLFIVIFNYRMQLIASLRNSHPVC
jgi:hypothetical protein